MGYDVQFLPAALKDFRKLPRKVQILLSAKVDALAEAPRTPEAKKLQGPGDLWRIREGDYRLMYQIRDAALLVLVIRTGHRREVYRQLSRLVKNLPE